MAIKFACFLLICCSIIAEGSHPGKHFTIISNGFENNTVNNVIFSIRFCPTESHSSINAETWENDKWKTVISCATTKVCRRDSRLQGFYTTGRA